MDAVNLSQPDAADGIDIGKPFEPASDLLTKHLDKGGHLVIFSPCMIHNGMTAEQMDPRFEIINAPDVIDLLMNAKGAPQVT